jgi:hypothetical protein
MHPERVGARREDAVGQGVEGNLGILLVDSDPALHGDRDAHCPFQRRDAFADQFRRAHQAGTEGAGLHAVGWTADVEVHLVVAEPRADAAGLGELCRIGAAELQRDRVLGSIEADQPLARAMDDGVGDDHLGVEQRTARQLAMQDPAMPIRPIHHRRDG